MKTPLFSILFWLLFFGAFAQGSKKFATKKEFEDFITSTPYVFEGEMLKPLYIAPTPLLHYSQTVYVSVAEFKVTKAFKGLHTGDLAEVWLEPVGEYTDPKTGETRSFAPSSHNRFVPTKGCTLTFACKNDRVKIPAFNKNTATAPLEMISGFDHTPNDVDNSLQVLVRCPELGYIGLNDFHSYLREIVAGKRNIQVPLVKKKVIPKASFAEPADSLHGLGKKMKREEALALGQIPGITAEEQKVLDKRFFVPGADIFEAEVLSHINYAASKKSAPYGLLTVRVIKSFSKNIHCGEYRIITGVVSGIVSGPGSDNYTEISSSHNSANSGVGLFSCSMHKDNQLYRNDFVKYLGSGTEKAVFFYGKGQVINIEHYNSIYSLLPKPEICSAIKTD